jgi:hypothetical protein
MHTEWDVDLTRAIEGVLDVSHLPFVHARTIGRGRKTLVNGPYTILDDDTIRIWVTNQPDEGLPAVKPTQLPVPAGEAMLEFRFPNCVLAEDYRVIRSQRPIVSDLDIGEHFVPADRPIAVFLQHRRDLIQAGRRPPDGLPEVNSANIVHSS